MTSFFFGGLFNLYKSICQKFWPAETAKKRRRDSSDEENDVLSGCETLSKRPRWMPNTRSKNSSMSFDVPGERSSRTSHLNTPGRVSLSARNARMQSKVSSATKQNGTDVVEISDVEDDSEPSVGSRPPLSSLTVRSRTKSPPRVYNSDDSTSHTSQKNHVLDADKQKNGCHPALFTLQTTFTTPLRFSRPSSTHKQTALSENFKMDDRQKYSALLTEFHKVANIKNKQNGYIHIRNSSHPSSVREVSPKRLNCVDRTQEERKRHQKPICIKAKPFIPSQHDKDDDVSFIREIPSLPRVNSLERQLSQNSLVSPEWIKEMKKKYDEREREAKRQVEEEKIKKELYAKHNQAKRIEALDEKIRRHLQITDVVLDDTEDATKLPDITPEMDKKITLALRPNPQSEVLVEGFSQRIKRQDIITLGGQNWLNDEVINFYMNLIMERGKEGEYRHVYAFNTFFYPKLVTHGYTSLRRWTKKVDIFSHDLILVPIHLGMHWCMAAVDFKDRSARYYDSMGSKNNKCLRALLKYLTEESLDKKKTPYDVNDWSMENVEDAPRQMNGFDCGVFACTVAEYLSRNAKLTFGQKDMAYFRRKMVYEIITRQLLQ